jgi:hypothetical protein
MKVKGNKGKLCKYKMGINCERDYCDNCPVWKEFEAETLKRYSDER